MKWFLLLVAIVCSLLGVITVHNVWHEIRDREFSRVLSEGYHCENTGALLGIRWWTCEPGSDVQWKPDEPDTTAPRKPWPLRFTQEERNANT